MVPTSSRSVLPAWVWLGDQLPSLRLGDRRKIGEEVGQGMPAIQIIEQRLHRHARLSAAGSAKADPEKARSPAHDLGIDGDDARLPLARFDSAGVTPPAAPVTSISSASPLWLGPSWLSPPDDAFVRREHATGLDGALHQAVGE